MMNEKPAEMKPRTEAGKLNQVIQWAVSGSSEYEILEAIAANFPEVDPSKILVQAMSHIAKNAEADLAMVQAWTFEAGKEIYRRMIEANDFGGGLKALKFLQETSKAMEITRARNFPEPEQDEEDAANARQIQNGGRG